MPEDELDELYQDILLDHYQHPRNCGHFDESEASGEGENPLCGDQIYVLVEVNGNKIENLKWHGRGCIISQSSASMMGELIPGRTIEEALKLSNQVILMLRGEKYDIPEDYMEDLESLKGVIKFPVRVKCATLAWNTVIDALQKNKN